MVGTGDFMNEGLYEYRFLPLCCSLSNLQEVSIGLEFPQGLHSKQSRGKVLEVKQDNYTGYHSVKAV